MLCKEARCAEPGGWAETAVSCDGARTKRWEPAAQPAEGLLGISDTIREHLGDKKPENLVKWEG